MKSKPGQSTVVSPEEAMNSYFSDLFCDSGQPLSHKEVPPSPALEYFTSAPVEPGFCLITTSKLNDRIVNFSQPQRALVESFTLLLWGLYFLRQPIPRKLRSQILEHCSEMSMEYHLLIGLVYSRLSAGEGG